ncbi:MAG: rod-binding protein [Deltaproteobacteria bacterium]|nr:rod-binding protein [Deltaproteobacteria bacterium]
MGPVRPAAEPADPKEAFELKKRQEAVRGFEEMFLTQLLKSMRKTVPGNEDQGSKKIWQERFDGEIARRIAEAGGIGLGPLIEKGMAGKGARK